MNDAPTKSEIVAMLMKAAKRLEKVDYNMSDELIAFADKVEATKPTTIFNAPWVKLPKKVEENE